MLIWSKMLGSRCVPIVKLTVQIKRGLILLQKRKAFSWCVINNINKKHTSPQEGYMIVLDVRPVVSVDEVLRARAAQLPHLAQSLFSLAQAPEPAPCVGKVTVELGVACAQ